MFRLAPLTLAVALALVAPASAPASFPGANGKLVFEAPTRGTESLFTVDPDGTGLARLTRLPGFALEPEWSPDGSKIVFAYAPSEESPLEIWSMDADGSNRTRLTRHRRFSIAPTWSPDGTKIAYATDKDGPFPERQRLPTGAAAHLRDECRRLRQAQARGNPAAQRDRPGLLP